ncbi:hypothetical protein EXIGLDRAFT_569223, partial [Exidia glandulosa HHB12029]
HQLDLRITLVSPNTRLRTPARALLDCGCTKTSIDASFARRMGFVTQPVQFPRPVYNADGSLNGHVKEVVPLEMEIRDADGALHRERLDFPVVNL